MATEGSNRVTFHGINNVMRVQFDEADELVVEVFGNTAREGIAAVTLERAEAVELLGLLSARLAPAKRRRKATR